MSEPRKHKQLARLIRRHNGLVAKRKRLEDALKPVAGEQDAGAGLKCLNGLLQEIVDSGKLPDDVQKPLAAALPLTIEKLQDDNGDLEKAIGAALRLWLKDLTDVIALPPPWGTVITMVLDLAIDLGARLAVWVLLKILVAGSKQGRLKAVARSIEKLAGKVTLLAKELGVALTVRDDGTIGAVIADDEDDDEVWEELPLAVA